MKKLRLPFNKSVTTSQFWILVVIGSLVTLHLGLILKRINEPGNINLLGTALLSWTVLLLQAWSQRDQFNQLTPRLSTYLGIAILILVIPVSLIFSNSVVWLHTLAFVSSLGIFLLLKGFQGLNLSNPILIILIILAIPEDVTHIGTGLPLLSAKCATFILAHLGFEVVNQGIHIILPTGGVNVDHGCSGAGAMFQLFRIALLFLVFFPTSLTQNVFVKALVALLAVSLAFVVNGFRIALLAFLAASHNSQAFDYWHTGSGSHIFSLTSVLLFSLFCYFLLRQDRSVISES